MEKISPSKFIKKIRNLLVDPIGFFEEVRGEGWRVGFIFFLKVTIILSIATPVVNYYGIESTDFSSSYQAQIMAYKIPDRISFNSWFGLHHIDFWSALLTFNLQIDRGQGFIFERLEGYVLWSWALHIWWLSTLHLFIRCLLASCFKST